MDATLSERIQLLPKEIQDTIRRFNVEHRPRMKPVFKVIKTLYFRCFVCRSYINDKPRDGVVYMMKRTYCCSRECEIIGNEMLRNVP
jgi:hypothetical protein